MMKLSIFTASVPSPSHVCCVQSLSAFAYIPPISSSLSTWWQLWRRGVPGTTPGVPLVLCQWSRPPPLFCKTDTRQMGGFFAHFILNGTAEFLFGHFLVIIKLVRAFFVRVTNIQNLKIAVNRFVGNNLL